MSAPFFDLLAAEAGDFRPQVSVGDRVERHVPLAEIETDKATLELTSPVAGVILELAPPGPIARGALALRIEEHDAATGGYR